MALALVQNKGVQSPSGTSHSATLTAAPTAGNLLVAAFSVPDKSATVTAPAGWTQAVTISDSVAAAARADIWYRVAQAGDSATVTFTTSTSTAGLEVVEVSATLGWPASPVDKTATNDGAAGTSTTTGSTGVLSQTVEFALALSALTGHTGGGDAATDSFTVLDGAVLTRSLAAYKITAATTALNPTLSWTTSRNPVACIATFKESSVTAVGDTLDARWGVRAPVADSVDARWTVRAAVSDTADARWSVRVLAADTLDARWAVRTAAGDTTDLRWATRALVADTTDLRWAIRTPTGDTLDARWAVRAPVSDTLDVRWQVLGLATVGVSVDLRWTVRAPAGDQLDVRWPVRGAVADTLTALWAARALAGDTLDARWATRRAVGDLADIRWAVRLPAGDALDLRWAVVALAAAAFPGCVTVTVGLVGGVSAVHQLAGGVTTGSQKVGDLVTTRSTCG